MPEQIPSSASTWNSTMGLIPSQKEGAINVERDGAGGGSGDNGGDNGGDGRRISFLGIIPMFLMTFVAFILLTLATFSLPFIPGLYFLWVSQAGGVRFGIWGWCLEEGSICSEKLGMGYTWEPEVAIPITKALALYPAAAISVFMTLIAFIPVLRDKTGRTLRIFAVFAWTSFVLAFIVFVFMIAMWSVADERFKAAGWKVHWGPLPWMSFIATVVLLIVALNTWKGVLKPPRSSLSSPQDPPLSAEGWSTTAEEDHQRLGSDPEKALNSPNDSITPRSRGLKEEFGLGQSSSPTAADNLGRKGSRRYRYDSLLVAKRRLSGRSSFENPLHASSPPDITIGPPPHALRRDSQKRFTPTLTPLHT